MRRLIRDVVRFWPILIFPPSLLVQSDLLVLYTTRWSNGLSPFLAFLIVAFVATAKMRWSFWLWGWLSRLLADTERFRQFTSVAKAAARLVWAEGLVDKMLIVLKLKSEQAYSNGTKLKQTLKAARWGSDTFLFGIGAHPMYGVRGPLVVVIGVGQWEREIRALMLGNLIRVAYLMGVLQALLSFLR